MNVLLYQLDGAWPNLALARLASHYRELGDHVQLVQRPKLSAIGPELFDHWDRVYGSALFSESAPLVEAVRRAHPGALLGGPGVDPKASLEQLGVAATTKLAYDLWPGWGPSLGYLSRGCRCRCEFCVVPEAEGRCRSVASVADVWRGEPWPRELLLLDNDFFGQAAKDWRARTDEVLAGRFKVSLCQGINCRLVTVEQATALAAMRPLGINFRERRLYTAWDHARDEAAVVRGIRLLLDAGIPAWSIVVYMLCGYAEGETHELRDHRRRVLRELRVIPHPMLWRRTRELMGFKRWVRFGYDTSVGWSEWVADGYQPRKTAAPEQLGLLSGTDRV